MKKGQLGLYCTLYSVQSAELKLAGKSRPLGPLGENSARYLGPLANNLQMMLGKYNL